MFGLLLLIYLLPLLMIALLLFKLAVWLVRVTFRLVWSVLKWIVHLIFGLFAVLFAYVLGLPSVRRRGST